MRRLVIQGVTPAEAARIARDLRNPDDRGKNRDETTGLTRSRVVVSLRRAALALDPPLWSRSPPVRWQTE
jgi:hypothetical protein